MHPMREHRVHCLEPQQLHVHDQQLPVWAQRIRYRGRGRAHKKIIRQRSAKREACVQVLPRRWNSMNNNHKIKRRHVAMKKSTCRFVIILYCNIACEMRAGKQGASARAEPSGDFVSKDAIAECTKPVKNRAPRRAHSTRCGRRLAVVWREPLGNYLLVVA